MDPAAPIEALGAGDARCRVGPGRGARLSTSPFPRTALRTRRASHPGTGLSTRPVTKQTVALPLGSAVPGLHDAVGRRSSPATPALPTRPAASLCPSPCARRSRARTPTGTPPRPATNSRRRACPPPEGGKGGDGSLPTFTTTRSTRSMPSSTRQPHQGYAAALPPGLPDRPLPTGHGVARRIRDGRALLTGPHPPGSGPARRLRSLTRWFL